MARPWPGAAMAGVVPSVKSGRLCRYIPVRGCRSPAYANNSWLFHTSNMSIGIHDSPSLALIRAKHSNQKFQ